MNMVLMAKLAWRLLSDGQSLWAQIITNKYVRGELSIKKLGKKKEFPMLGGA